MTEGFRILVAQNIAINGRTFFVMLFAACLAVFLIEHDPLFVRLAVGCALPMGLSNLVERGSSRFWLGVLNVVYGLVAAVVILNLLLLA